MTEKSEIEKVVTTMNFYIEKQMSIWIYKGTVVTVAIERNKNKIIYYTIIIPNNYVWNRNMDIRKNGGKKIDCFGEKNPKKNFGLLKSRKFLNEE